MSKAGRNVVAVSAVVAALAATAWFARGRIHFDWANLVQQMRAVRWIDIVAATALIWFSIILRAPRWKLLMGARTPTSSAKLVAPQFVGFTAVALLGRVADLARPYLIARRSRTPVSAQLAVYSMERAFDLGAAAILFSLTLAFTPASMPHHEAFKTAGLYALSGTLLLAMFAVATRVAGGAIAAFVRRILGIGSHKLGGSVAAKVLDFRDGLRSVSSARQFLGALVLSIVIWIAIAASYFVTAHAFRDCAPLATLTIAGTMLLMAASMGGSLLQLPVVGWFTQIGVLAVALHAFFGAPVEIASAAGAAILFVNTLSIIPVGLVLAKIEGVGLRDAARSSAAETAAESTTAAETSSGPNPALAKIEAE